MGKKKYNKNKKGKNRYTKSQFLDIYCLNCDLCRIQPPDPIFCYEELYKIDPNRFLESCFVGLMKAARGIRESNLSSNDITINRFRELFCEPFCKRNSCGLLLDCFNLFKDQINGRARSKANMHKNKKKRKKSRQRYICEPYPTIFTSDNEEWQLKIENILSNENNNRKQDKAKESTKQLEGQVNK